MDEEDEDDMNRQDLRVVAAAILHDDRIYTLPPPARHHNIIRMMSEEHGLGPECMHEQGFLLNNGYYCRRTPARVIAENAGQLIRKPEHFKLLFSEDLW